VIRPLILGMILAACGPKATPEPEEPTPPPPKTSGAELTAKMLGQLKTTVGCPSATAPLRVWCIAADGWATGTAAPFPDGEHVYAGLSAGLIEDESIEDGLTGNVFFAVLGVKNDAAGGKAKGLITDINPKGVDEQHMVAEATAEITEVLKGKRDAAKLPQPLMEWIQQVPPSADHALIQDANGWRLEGAARAEIRKVGDYWVALEQPTEGPPGLFVSIFTDRIVVKP
jgi:hypothetical protein